MLVTGQVPVGLHVPMMLRATYEKHPSSQARRKTPKTPKHMLPNTTSQKMPCQNFDARSQAVTPNKLLNLKPPENFSELDALKASHGSLGRLTCIRSLEYLGFKV